MVSYRQLASGQVVLHERETTSSGRPKPILMSEDDDYKYDQTRSGVVTKRNKTNLEHYLWWHKHNVEFAPVGKDGRYGNQRITPLSEFESRLGVKTSIPSYYYKWCAGYGTGKGESWGCQKKTFTHEEWQIFKQTHTIDYGELEVINKTDMPKKGESWENYFRDKANKLNLEIVGEVYHLNFREKQKPAVVEKVRPNPKEESIASVKIEKPEPIEPIKEVEKYSPLMIAGVIAVVVILLLKRRRA